MRNVLFITAAILIGTSGAIAAPITDSAGNPVMSYRAGVPVVQGPYLIENDNNYGTTVESYSVETEREICKRASFLGGLKKGLHKKGFTYGGFGSFKWTKTVTDIEERTRLVRVRNGRGMPGADEGREGGDGGAASGGRGVDAK